jgi:glycosyltransferase involved in cell wall biosynthesis
MQKISVLFLTNAYPDFDSSYRGIFIKKMASLLKTDGYDIAVVTPKIYKKSRYVEEQNGMKVYRLPFFSENRLLIEYDKIPYLRMCFYYVSGFLLSLYAFIRHRCQMIHVHWAIPTGLIGVGIAFLSRKPLMVTIHGSDFRLAMDESSFLKRIFLYVCKKANHLHCVSDGMKRELEDLGINGGRISAFPMGIEAGFLDKEGVQRMGSDNRPTTILSNRNLLPIYNVSLFIRAIPLVLREESKVRFLIAGDGPEREGLEREAKNLNIGNFVQFLGRMPHDAMLNLLSQTDIYVSTSLHDGTSVSLLEALGSGAFPVVTDIPSNREWISDGENGFLVPTDQERILAMRVIEGIRNRSLVEKARQKNLRLVTEKVLWPETIEKTKRIYEKVLSSES